MRNFHNSNAKLIISHDINGGEYCRYIDVDLVDEILRAVAEAMQVGIVQLRSCYSYAVELIQNKRSTRRFYVNEEWNFTPAELEIVLSLARKVSKVSAQQKVLDGPYFPGKPDYDSSCWFYVNMNTGKAVTWVHHIC